MKVRLMKYPNREDLNEVKAHALTTMGKTAVSEVTDEWLYKIADAEHSPIRELVFKFRMDAPYWVLNELRTHHVGCEMYMQSSRNDRQGDFDRNEAPQGMMRTADFVCNLQSLIDIARKRLCHNATREMQSLVAMMCDEVENRFEWTKGLFVPQCIYRGGWCHEMKGCGYCPKAGEK